MAQLLLIAGAGAEQAHQQGQHSEQQPEQVEFWSSQAGTEPGLQAHTSTTDGAVVRSVAALRMQCDFTFASSLSHSAVHTASLKEGHCVHTFLGGDFAQAVSWEPDLSRQSAVIAQHRSAALNCRITYERLYHMCLHQSCLCCAMQSTSRNVLCNKDKVTALHFLPFRTLAVFVHAGKYCPYPTCCPQHSTQLVTSLGVWTWSTLV